MNVFLFKMKFFQLGFIAICFLSPIFVIAQDPAVLFNEARDFERKYKEEPALAKYQEILVIQPSHMQALLKCAELSGSIGARATKQEDKIVFLYQAKGFADAAVRLDSTSADAVFATALVNYQLSLAEKEKDVATEHLRQVKVLSEWGLQLDKNHGKCHYLLGKWHLEVYNQSDLKKAAAKLLFGGLPKADLATAIQHLEASKTTEPYLCPNFLDLAKAYQLNKNYEKAIQTLEQLAKLPARKQDDLVTKATGKEMLQQLQ